MPRVIHLVKRYNESAGRRMVFFVEVSEQNIMDCEITANRNGHIACTHGGESLAGLLAAKERGILDGRDIAILDSTAHALKFAGFQEMYFAQQFPPEYNISPNPDLINTPVYIHPQDLDKVPAPGKPLSGEDFKRFVTRVAKEIATKLDLKKAYMIAKQNKQMR
jgi:threonine synthase